MNARPALAGGAFTAGYAVCNPGNAGWVVASTANLAGGTVDIGGIALETAVSGGASVQVLTAGYCPPEVIGTLSGTGDWVQVGSTGALTRGTSVTSATIGKYQSDGGVIVNLSLQSALVVAAVYDSGYVLVSDYGTTDAALTAADAVAQGYTPAKRLLLTQQVTISASMTLSSPWKLVGGSVSVNSSQTLSCLHRPDAEAQQIFYGSGDVVFLPTGGLVKGRPILPEWFGAVGDVIATTGTVSSGSTALTNGAGLLTTAMVTKVVVLYNLTTKDAHATTLSARGSSTTGTLALAPSVTFTSQPMLIGSDDQAAIRKAIVASGGRIPIQFTAPLYGVSASVNLVSGSGYGPQLHGNGTTICALATISGGVLSTDNGAATNTNQTQGVIENLGITGSMLANYGLLFGKLTAGALNTNLSGFVGDVHDITISACLKSGALISNSQSGMFSRIKTQYTGEHGIQAIGCNGTLFEKCIGYTTIDASMHGVVVDSKTGMGSGGVILVGCGGESCTGDGLRVQDTDNIGTTVTVMHPWCENNAGDGVVLDREGCVLFGGTFTGNSSAGNYPIRIKSKGKGCSVRGVRNVSNYTNLSTLLDTGVTECDIESNYIPSLDDYRDPSVTDGWAGKFHLLARNGDLHLQGSAGIGTYAPREALDIVDGNVMVRYGAHVVTCGGLASGFGGIARGQNLLVRSRAFSNATWQKGAGCAVTADNIAGPVEQTPGGTTADKIDFTGTNTALRFTWQEANVNTLLGYADLDNGGTKYYGFAVDIKASAACTVRLTINAAGASPSTFADVSATTAWQTFWVHGTFTGTAATNLRCMISQLDTTSVTIYADNARAYERTDPSMDAPDAFAYTDATARAVAANGPTFNAVPVVPGDSFTAVAGGKVAVAGAVVTITDARCTATCMIDFEPTNAAAVTLGNASRAPAAGSFALTFAGAPGGTETFNYRLTEMWKL